MPGCVLVISDLIFRTRITAAAADAGARCRVVGSATALGDALAAEPADLVIIDLGLDDGLEAVAGAAAADPPPPRIVAFVSHVDRERANQARHAGATEVMPRSLFVQRLGEMMRACGI